MKYARKSYDHCPLLCPVGLLRAGAALVSAHIRVRNICLHPPNAVEILMRMTDPTHLALIRSYAARWEAGECWPLPYLQPDRLTICDGCHRFGAAVLLGLDVLDVNVLGAWHPFEPTC
jgi:hypothetical protein